MKSVENASFDWPKVLETLKPRLGSEVIERWLAPLSVDSCDKESVTLKAPNPFFRDWIKSHYSSAIVALSGGRKLEIIAAQAGTTAEVLSQIVPLRPPANTDPTTSRAPNDSSNWTRPLNPKFNFESFVVGASNRFAHAASIAVSDAPAKAYNPLFIYGGVGLGKTHLMQAIGQAVLARWPKSRIVYASSESFTNELIRAIQTKTTAKFRNRYRTVDVLLIDDIHFIAEKEATQEEFFHTFNTLYDSHKQIVMSSDRLPKDIAGLEERLVSRFEWGLVTDIQSPDLETRTAILRKKAEESGVAVLDEVTDFIAKQVTSNIRELEGALIRVVAYCNLFNTPQSADVAREVLKDMVREVSSRVTIDSIQKTVSGYFEVQMDELRGARRQRSILYPRQVAMYLCRKLTPASFPEIGKAFGGRDHTTVMHTVEKIERDITQDLQKKHTVEHINRLVLNSSQ